jgi:hypothetical protein
MTSRLRSTGAQQSNQVERASLIALARRHLLRARYARPGSSVMVLHDDGHSPVICMVALTARRTLAGLTPADDGTALQVLQGQVEVRRSGRAATTFPGDMVMGPLSQMEITAVTDCVVLVTCERARRSRIPA